MRCLACDCELTDREATRRSVKSGEFLDLCNTCYEPIKDEIPSVEGRKYRSNEVELEAIVDELTKDIQ